MDETIYVIFRVQFVFAFEVWFSICALWSPTGKRLTSWLSFVVYNLSLSLSYWYAGSGVVLDCIDSLNRFQGAFSSLCVLTFVLILWFFSHFCGVLNLVFLSVGA